MTDAPNDARDTPTDDTPSDDLHDLVQEVAASHGDQGAGAMADELRDRVAETETGEEDEGDRQN